MNRHPSCRLSRVDAVGDMDRRSDGSMGYGDMFEQIRASKLASQRAIQAQVKSPPPRGRTAAQVAQARMGWKLRLQQEQKSPKGKKAPTYVPNASPIRVKGRPPKPPTTRRSHSDAAPSWMSLSPQTPLRTPGRSSSDGVDSVATAVEVANKVHAAYEAHKEASQVISDANRVAREVRAVSPPDEKKSFGGQTTEKERLYGHMLQALPQSDPSFNEVINILHMAMPAEYERPSGAIIRAIATHEGTVDYLSFNKGRISENCWVDVRDLKNYNSVDELHKRGGKFMPQLEGQGILFSANKIEPKALDSWDGIISVVMCKVCPGRPYWIPRPMAGDLTKKPYDDGAFYPDNLSPAFDSICVSPEDFPLVKSNDVCRHLVRQPNQALACWHVTFCPHKKDVTNAAKASENKEEADGSKGDDEAGDDDSTRVAAWQRRFKLKNRETHREDHWNKSVNAPEARKSATLAFQRLQIEIDFIREALQKQMVDLHGRMEAVHENYVETEEVVNETLQASLHDYAIAQESRRYALLAWKRQLEAYMLHINLMERLERTAGGELTSAQKVYYDAAFKEAAEKYFPRPKQWNPEKNPGLQIHRPIEVNVSQEVFAGPVSVDVRATERALSPSISSATDERVDSPPNVRKDNGVLPPSTVYSHILDFREQWEDPLARAERLDSTNDRTVTRTGPKPPPTAQKDEAVVPESDSLAVNDDGCVEMSGWMLTNTSGKATASGWKRRYFVLSSSKLTWQENEFSNSSLGSLYLSSCQIRLEMVDGNKEAQTETDFTIESPSGSLVMRANSDSLSSDHGGPRLYRRKQWMHALKTNIEAARSAFRKKRGLFASFHDHDAFEILDNILCEGVLINYLSAHLEGTTMTLVTSLIHDILCARGCMAYSNVVTKILIEDIVSSGKPLSDVFFKRTSIVNGLVNSFLVTQLKPLISTYFMPLLNMVQARPKSYSVSNSKRFRARSAETALEMMDIHHNFLHLCLSMARAVSLIFEEAPKGVRMFLRKVSLFVDGNLPQNDPLVGTWMIRHTVLSAICPMLRNAGGLVPEDRYGVDYLTAETLAVVEMIAETLETMARGKVVTDDQTAYEFLENGTELLEEWKSLVVEENQDDLKVHLDAGLSDQDVEALAMGLHQFLCFAHKKGREFFEFRNSPVGQNVKGKVQVFDRRRFLEAVFDMFSGHADVEVRKNYGRVSE